MSLAKTSAIGRLTKDPEVRTVKVGGQDTAVANFSIACDRDFGEGTDFYDVVVWRKTAENVGKFLGKGRLVYVEGRFQKRTYEATLPGTDTKYPRDVWELHSDRVQFLDKAPEGNQGGGQQRQQGNYQQQNYQQNQQQQQQQYQPYGGNAPF